MLSRAGLQVEADLELVGVTAIEDKLQAGVPEAIRTLIAAGMRARARPRRPRPPLSARGPAGAPLQEWRVAHAHLLCTHGAKGVWGWDFLSSRGASVRCPCRCTSTKQRRCMPRSRLDAPRAAPAARPAARPPNLRAPGQAAHNRAARARRSG